MILLCGRISWNCGIIWDWMCEEWKRISALHAVAHTMEHFFSYCK